MTTLVKRNNGLSLLPELPGFLGEPVIRDWFNFNNNNTEEEAGTMPAVNIVEHDDNYEISVAAPGMTRNDFKVEFTGNRLVISAERQQQKEQKDNSSYLRKEFSYQSFVRSFTLAEKQVDGEKIKAKYADGILCITVPKTATAKRTIQIS